MADDLKIAMMASYAAIGAQSTRLRIVSENLANATSTSAVPGGDPYARKTITFNEVMDRATGASLVSVGRIATDPTPFRIEQDPGHPAADPAGNVKLPNVNPLLELADLREAHRSYEANLQVVRQGREMLGDLLELLRSR